RRVLPSVVNGVRLYLCDTRLMANYTVPGPYGTRNGVTKDALLCMSDPRKPLLDPDRFVFPIDRSDGFNWSMAENSHTYAFLHPGRQHEGTDISLADGKANPVHALVAFEEATVAWVHPHSGEQACICLESRSTPGVYYIYQHIEAATVSVKTGDSIRKGTKLGYIWGDNSWGHLHFGIVGWGDEPVFDTRYANSIPAFAMLYELWNDDLELRPKIWSWGMWTFVRNRATVQNVKRQNAFDEKLGYGWLLGDWCPAKKVEPVEGKDQFSSALLKKTLFAESVSAATNPKDFYDFEIAVPNGNYSVNLLLGDVYQPTWQRVEIEGIDAGTYDLPPNALSWVGEKRARVEDGRLTVRIHLKDDATYASLSELSFYFRDRRPQ
ncbi:MAG: peptidoglycan DD-metalloendopeptidase family protein, partial [Verrucomicrobiae bacterium]|nr:peptidoglycan DD-metalloendopeptidase family protein [Verrucomicrobiae bacterium]